MTIVAQIDALIATLTAAKEDAAKVDAGKTGAPGTRVRQAAQDIKVGCTTLRESVIAARQTE